MEKGRDDTVAVLEELQEWAAANVLTQAISEFLVHPGFPVDIRHNAKIFREKLRPWAEDKINRQDAKTPRREEKGYSKGAKVRRGEDGDGL